MTGPSLPPEMYRRLLEDKLRAKAADKITTAVDVAGGHVFSAVGIFLTSVVTGEFGWEMVSAWVAGGIAVAIGRIWWYKYKLESALDMLKGENHG